MNEISLYFHIPFCLKKCNYCNFYSVKFNKHIKQKYIEYLIKEISLNVDLINNFKIKTLYFGGGTPSVLDENDFDLILNFLDKNFNINEVQEITLEVNPETVSLTKFKNLKKIGINRISIGAQTFKEESLKILGRVHSKKKIFDSFQTLRSIGFNNINIDLILGIPNENMKDLEYTLKNTILLNPEHISIYSLEYHEDTKFYFDLIKGKIKPWNKLKEKKGYLIIKNFLESNGYKQYEISNYAKRGYESIHNLNYWNGGEYIGFGSKSFSFIKNFYLKNGDLFSYFKFLNSNKKPYTKIYWINDEKLKNLLLILSLRKIEGVNLKKFEEKFGKINERIYEKLLNLEKKGHIEKYNENIRLTIEGIIISNEVFSNLI